MRYNKKDDTYQYHSAFKVKQNKIVESDKITYKVLSCLDLKWITKGDEKGYLLTLKEIKAD